MQIDANKGIANYILEDTKEQPQMTVLGEHGKKCEKRDGEYAIANAQTINMADITYFRPGTEENGANDHKTVADMISESGSKNAMDRYNEVAVLANTTSSEDLKKLQEEGFSVNNTDTHTIVTVTDKIKVTLAKAGVDISEMGDAPSDAAVRDMAGNTYEASKIERALKEKDLPATEENIKDTIQALHTTEDMGSLSNQSRIYMVKNQIAPTIENVYKAAHSAYVGNGKESQLSEDEFAAMQGQVEQTIKEAGFSVNQDTLGDCKILMEAGVGLTADNLRYFYNLGEISFADNDVMQAITESISLGQRPLQANLIPKMSLQFQAEDAMQVVSAATDADVAAVVANNQELTIEHLREAQKQQEQYGEQTSPKGQDSPAFVTAKRQLEEARLQMTVSANLSLLKRGISIDTKPLIALVEDLKAQENQYAKDLLSQNGVESSEENIAVFTDTTQAIEDLKGCPAYILRADDATDRLEKAADHTLRSLHQAGTNLKQSFDLANQRYETLMTAPRADMGDSIHKAFANVDDILNDLDLETSEANRRAVRILAYNNTALTTENIEAIKIKDEEVQRVFKNMTPRVVVDMIRQNMNPMDMDMHMLNEKAEAIKEQYPDREEERFSKYLYKLEQNHEISEEERSSYIGIYRLIAQVEKTDGAAIGSLLQQGSDITMRSLLTAVRTGNKGHMDYEISDDFAGINGVSSGTRIDDQIRAGYQKNCLHDAMDLLSPEKVKTLTDEQVKDMTPEQLKETLENADTAEATDFYEQQYMENTMQEMKQALTASEDVYTYLQQADIPNTIQNIQAVKEMLQNRNKMFSTLWSAKTDSFDAQRAIEDAKELILERFGEALESPQELADAQQTLAEVATHVMDSMIIEKDSMSTLDLKALRMMSAQFTLCAKQTSDECYMIPLETGEGVTGVSLKVIRGTEKKGLVDILFEGHVMGKVAASFEAKENGISGMIATDNEETRQLLSDHLGMLAQALNEDGSETVDLRVALTKNLSLEHYEVNTRTAERTNTNEKQENASYAVQTKRLYHIAESFITTIQEYL